MGKKMVALMVGMALAITGIAAACGTAESESVGPNSSSPPDDGGRLVVATTVAPVTSIAAAVIGDRADIEGIVPEGTNSHTFEPPPRTAELLSKADVVFLNGLQLEEPTRQMAEANADEETTIVELGERTIDADQYLYDFSFPEDGGKPNPHLWTDPSLVRRYAEIIRDTMSERDPSGTAVYEANFQRYSDALAELDQAMRESFASLPSEDRKLLTYHDAYAYFAQTYDWTVVGAIQVSDFGDPSPREVAGLIDQVRTEGVKAVFGSEVFPSPVLEQIGRETGVRYVDTLRDDDLPGEPGEPDHSLIGLLRYDYLTLTEALGGDAAALAELDVSFSVQDQATYPQ